MIRSIIKKEDEIIYPFSKFNGTAIRYKMYIKNKNRNVKEFVTSYALIKGYYNYSRRNEFQTYLFYIDPDP